MRRLTSKTCILRKIQQHSGGCDYGVQACGMQRSSKIANLGGNCVRIYKTFAHWSVSQIFWGRAGPSASSTTNICISTFILVLTSAGRCIYL